MATIRHAGKSGKKPAQIKKEKLTEPVKENITEVLIEPVEEKETKTKRRNKTSTKDNQILGGING